MTAEWGSLPLLPLRCVLEQLSTADALAAMSVCRHWRTAMLLYEGHKDVLKLRLKQVDRSVFLTRVFRRCTKKLQIYINCSRVELDNFMNHLLPLYLDTYALQELAFIGPAYLMHSHHAPIVKLDRELVESIMFKHTKSLRTLRLLGCELTQMRHDRMKLLDISRPETFDPVTLHAEKVLMLATIGFDSFSSLQYLALDCEQLSNPNMEILSQLNLSQLTLTVGLRRCRELPRFCWPKNLRVAVNVVNVSHERLSEVMHNVLVDGMFLISLKVMFCQTLHTPLINHVVRTFKTSLQELVWVDSPYEEPGRAAAGDDADEEYDMSSVNPLILLCWQCLQLRRLVLHGYWIWQYELVGLVRLRKSLEMLEVSAVYEHSGRFGGTNGMMPVLTTDRPLQLHESSVQQVNEYTGFDWRPILWSDLHPGLRAGSTPQQRACYVLRELGTR